VVALVLNQQVGRTDVLVQWLRGLEEGELASFLERRPDALRGAVPRDFVELAQRLDHVDSLTRALTSLCLPCLQLAEAIQALGGACSRSALTDFLTDSGPDHQSNVDHIVEQLVAIAVVTRGERGRLELPDAMAQIFANPLRLGEPLYILLRDCNVEAMRNIQHMLGLARGKNRSEIVESLLAVLGDAGRVRAILGSAPAGIAAYLEALADGGPLDDGERFNPAAYQRQQSVIQWAGARGLMIGAPYGYTWQMPNEVARAIRGAAYRAPFTPQRPQPPIRKVDQAQVGQDSAAAASRFADHVLALLDHIARAPVPGLKSGGIGTRELTKLARVCGTDDTEVRLALELADAAGLLDLTGQTVAASGEFAAWRDAEPGTRFEVLLSAWWGLGATPTESQDETGKARPSLARRGPCDGCRRARAVLLECLAELDGAADRASVARAALWRRPLVHIVDRDEREPFTIGWREAELLGVISQGLLTDLGRLLLEGDAELLRKHATGLLPPSTDQARFGADLTVFVVGTPAARVSRWLDSAADREGHGGAVTWRFSPTSVRRALDGGVTGEALAAALRQIATAELPQPLTYLIADVARRHGRLRLTAAVSCIRSDDIPLLAEVAADRRLARLGLRLLAPTVLASDVTVEELLAALRAVGYFPVAETPTDNVTKPASPPEPAAQSLRPVHRPQVATPEPADAHAVAVWLMRSQTVTPEPVTPTEEILTRLATALSAAEVRQLAYAIDTGSRVGIEYQSAAGKITRRIVEGPELVGISLFGWCELRQDDRVFTVGRIVSVLPT
jgi:Helicase conserved C-terminal domain